MGPTPARPDSVRWTSRSRGRRPDPRRGDRTRPRRCQRRGRETTGRRAECHPGRQGGAAHPGRASRCDSAATPRASGPPRLREVRGRSASPGVRRDSRVHRHHFGPVGHRRRRGADPAHRRSAHPITAGVAGDVRIAVALIVAEPRVVRVRLVVAPGVLAVMGVVRVSVAIAWVALPARHLVAIVVPGRGFRRVRPLCVHDF